jgi:DNA-binding transcriptional MerR regulator
MDELVQRVREALAAEYPGAPNGRVRDVPDRRAIRWYTTIGLVDKPLGMRGRTALYGPRHLQQLVAIKRRQAEGRSLADIQVEFSWLAPQQLGELARVPDQLLAGHNEPVRDHSAGAARLRFWAESPAAADSASAGSGPVGTGPTPSTPTLPTSIPSTSAGSAPTLPAPAPSVPARSAVAEQMSAVPLGGGVILLVPGTVDDHDRDAIAAAATPLLTLLAVRGLTDGSSS